MIFNAGGGRSRHQNLAGLNSYDVAGPEGRDHAEIDIGDTSFPGARSVMAEEGADEI